MTELGVTRKFSFGPTSYRSIDFHDIINVEDPNDDEEVMKAFQQSLARIDNMWEWYRKIVEEAHGKVLPPY